MKPTINSILLQFAHLTILLERFSLGDVDAGYEAADKIEDIRVSIWKFVGML